jgi:hypothetical protein
MSNPFLLIFSLIALGVFYVLLPAIASVFVSYRRPRPLRCPETKAVAEVGIAAWRAALTQFLGPPRLRAKACSLWPERGSCGQRCLLELQKTG